METPEERRLRKAAKKEAKKKQQMMGYNNDDNPFQDHNLEEPFIWKKKYSSKGVEKITPEVIEKINKSKFSELEKLKKRREEREKEREQRVKEMEAKERDTEAGKFKTWFEGEEKFVFKQAKLRSAVRLREGRAKTIDILVAYINAFSEKNGGEKDEPQIDLIEPYLCLNGLRINDLEDLKEDIKLYKQLDDSNHLEYWKYLEIIVDDELKKLRYSSKSLKDQPDGINPTIAKELNKIIENKTPEELENIQKEIEKKMTNGREVIDISYWETLLGKIRANLARARLHDKHQELMVKIKEREKLKPKTETKPYSEDDKDNERREDEDNEEIDPLESCIKEYEAGQYSPKLLRESDLDSDITIVNPDDDWSKLEHRRRYILTSPPLLPPLPSSSASSSSSLTEPGTSKSISMSAEEKEFERAARSGMGTNEGILRSEETIIQDSSVSSWSEKYRPRKPRYFNRVHTGFEWNKYNQTHYDIDNPPPKIVQGYKFNIFYPDLINKGKAPTYTVTPCQDNKDFAIIRFKAGPPYEDIAFKIVNREWNYSHKSGFRCQFINNILQLWFHFKRYRYRR